MPIYIKEQNGTINHYEHCTVYNGVPETQQQAQEREVEDVVPIEEQPATHQSMIRTEADNEMILDLLFRADDDDRERTKILLSALLKGKKVKTKIVAALRENRRCFN